MNIEIREMTIADYETVYNLWRHTEGIGLSDADSKEGIKRFLERNPGLSFVAVDAGQVVGAALCGHDGRRGYIHHLAVASDHRKQGIGRSLVGRVMYALMRLGIGKCHLFVFDDNKEAITFWNKVGWTERVELIMMSQQLADDQS
ncbi:MAG: GNAT family N-acetyltransferase [Anaerolineales bacterium]|nr:GNAT family N-acetyltransferase [Anaerolineales bacterium]